MRSSSTILQRRLGRDASLFLDCRALFFCAAADGPQQGFTPLESLMDPPGDGAPVLTGFAGMEMINEMFQRQARRVETQLQQQANDRRRIDVSNAQLLVMQSQLMWHAQHYQDRSEQVAQSAETIVQMHNYIEQMAAEQARSVGVAQQLSADVASMREQLEPHELKAVHRDLSEIAKGTTHLASLPYLGELFTGGVTVGASSSYAHLSSLSSLSDDHRLGELIESKKSRKSGIGSSASQRSPAYTHLRSSTDQYSHDSSCSDSADASAASTVLSIAKRHPSTSHAEGASHASSHASPGTRGKAAKEPHENSHEPPPLTAQRPSCLDAANHTATPIAAFAPSAAFANTAAASSSSVPLSSAVGGGGPPSFLHPQHGLLPTHGHDPALLPLVTHVAHGHDPAVPALRGAVPLPSVPLATAPLASGMVAGASAKVMQGVLPYPGQCLLEFQQGVVTGEALEPFVPDSLASWKPPALPPLPSHSSQQPWRPALAAFAPMPHALPTLPPPTAAPIASPSSQPTCYLSHLTGLHRAPMLSEPPAKRSATSVESFPSSRERPPHAGWPRTEYVATAAVERGSEGGGNAVDYMHSKGAIE